MAATPDDSSRRTSRHRPVLLRETITQLQLSPGLTVVDGTVGAGGHSEQILKQIGNNGLLIGLDRDPMMLQFAAQKLTGENVILKQASYADLESILEELELPGVDRILVDLGLSSDQLEHEARGFGFSTEGKLDMRFDPSTGLSARELLNCASKDQLTQILEDYGEERFAESIAGAIVAKRERSPIDTVQSLNEVVESAIPAGVLKKSEKHPATRVYQALRIAVNDELNHLQRALRETFPRCLNTDGILAAITFHSLEDRLVKRAFQDEELWENLTAKPISPRSVEQKMNPRSRSAKLRVARTRWKNPET